MARSVTVVSPSAIRAERAPADEPPTPRRYTPVRQAAAPSVTWEQTQREESAAEPWAAIGERLAASPSLTERGSLRRMPWGAEPQRALPAPAPTVPDLMPGAEASARKLRMGRVGALLGEASRLLDGEPDAVRERAKRALDRVG